MIPFIFYVVPVQKCIFLKFDEDECGFGLPITNQIPNFKALFCADFFAPSRFDDPSSFSIIASFATAVVSSQKPPVTSIFQPRNSFLAFVPGFVSGLGSILYQF